MHLNHYFLTQFAAELKNLLVDSWLLEAFTQEKDELILAFAKQGQDYYLKCRIGAGLQTITVLEDFNRARKNSVDLFAEAMELKVVDVSATPNDRSFTIQLKKGGLLLFKMHGSKSNVIFYKNEKGIAQFHKNSPDITFAPNAVDRLVDFNIDSLVTSGFDFRTQLPALGKEPLKWLETNGFATADEETKIELVCQLLELLHYPTEFYIINVDGKAVLSFFKNEHVLGTFNTAIEASNALLKFYYSFSEKNRQTDGQQKTLLDKQKRLVSYLAAIRKRLYEITHSNVFEETANILMANLHAIPARAETVILYDFYQNADREIKLKKDLSPQKNAENYYRKSKNLSVEIENIQKTIEIKALELEKIEASLQKLEKGETLAKTEKIAFVPKQQQEEKVPYKRFEFEDFEIRVGKSSQKNDELIQEHASKNDLWLHARGYAGSHVIIKQQAGKPFPQAVIEKAASLAAWYSKGKNDSLCPVIVTEKKYVRKAKGMAPGQVIVEKEKTLMVTPSEF